MAQEPETRHGSSTRLEPQLRIAILAVLVTLVVGLVPLYIYHIDHHSSNTILLGENPIPISSLTIVASKREYFQRHHLDVKAKQFSSGREALDALLAGDAQFATVAETPLVLASFAKEKLVVLATIGESKSETQLLVNTDKIHRLDDLNGAVVATTRGTNADYFMYAFLQHHGISPTKVKVVSMRPFDMVSAMAQGSIAACFTWQPFIAKGLLLKGVHTAAYSGGDFYTMTFNIVTSKAYADGHKEEVQQFLGALKDAEDDINREPKQAQGEIADRIGIDEETLSELWPSYDLGLRLDDTLVTAMEDQRAWAMHSGDYHYDSTPDFRQMLFPEPLRAVDSTKVRLK